MEMVITKGSFMMQKIRPWFIMDKERYTNPRLRPDTPQEIIDLYEEYKKWRDEYNRTRNKSNIY